jgi:hypothetical protein
MTILICNGAYCIMPREVMQQQIELFGVTKIDNDVLSDLNRDDLG